MYFNTYEDMEKAIANERLFGSPESVEFIEAMIGMFERELEDACEKADSAGYDIGYEDGSYSGYEEGYQACQKDQSKQETNA
jgi:flagellar biosynthesis/type III secretory pathway protein FliH